MSTMLICEHISGQKTSTSCIQLSAVLIGAAYMWAATMTMVSSEGGMAVTSGIAYEELLMAAGAYGDF